MLLPKFIRLLKQLFMNCTNKPVDAEQQPFKRQGMKYRLPFKKQFLPTASVRKNVF